MWENHSPASCSVKFIQYYKSDCTVNIVSLHGECYVLAYMVCGLFY